jgi:hypothetical protein
LNENWQWLLAVFLIAAAVLGALRMWRWVDARHDRDVWRSLAERASRSAMRFDERMVADLPEPVRRYFLYAIAPGTPLRSCAEIEMAGELGLGTKAAPGYREMHARQILAAPDGFVWRVRFGSLSGSDGAAANGSWTRFWFLGLLPVARVGGDPDHHRSAMGRMAAEAVFWTPAALLPGPGICWEARDADTARLVMRIGGHDHVIDLTVTAEGQPTRIVLQRWSNANPEKTYRLQTFGGDLSDFRTIDGYRVPMHVEGGNLIGAEAYFPFYKAEVRRIRYLDGSGEEPVAGKQLRQARAKDIEHHA